MSLDATDPRLTAYALGELPANEREAFERELANHPAAQAELRQIQAAADALTTALAAESSPRLQPAQRVAIHARMLPGEEPTRWLGWKRLLWTTGLATAGSILLVALLLPGFTPPRQLQASKPTEESIHLAQIDPPVQETTIHTDPESAFRLVDENRTLPEPVVALGQPPGHSAPAPFGCIAVPQGDGRPGILQGAQYGLGQAAPGLSGRSQSFEAAGENPFHPVSQQPLSTFGLEVDTAAYANLRQHLKNGLLPPAPMVRLEEMLNYFNYNYPEPSPDELFTLSTKLGECPWNRAHRLAVIGLKAKEVRPREQPPLNLVLLIDVSGSMAAESKLPLLQQALRLLVHQLTGRDRVGIVVYAEDSRLLLPSTRGDDHEAILAAIEQLRPGGSTNGGAGIQSAYEQATGQYLKQGVNRVILCTDGDFNVGITKDDELVELIRKQAASGVFLSVFGVGMGDLRDAKLEKLAHHGNGQYGYLDGLAEARKVFVDEIRGSLLTVAKDVKLQVEFNPERVQAYRLLGYENRILPARAFKDDRQDAGEIGAGHTVTALYEIVPAAAAPEPGVDPLKYQPRPRPQRSAPRHPSAFADEWMTVKLRYKEPTGDKSQLRTTVLTDRHQAWADESEEFRFAAAVAAFGLLLRNSPYKAEASFDLVRQLAQEARSHDPHGHRREFLELVERARQLAR